MKMKIYKVIFEDGQNAYREIIPAESIKQLKDQWGGNGEIIFIKDVTSKWTTNYAMLTPCGIERLVENLKDKTYGDNEIDIIVRTLRHVYNF